MRRPGAMFSELFRHIFRRRATVLYPYERLEIPDGFRGKIEFNLELCTGCKLCARDCPAEAIEMVETGEEKRKFRPRFYLDRCAFCGQCEENCPKGAIKLTKGFELASYDRKSLILE